MRAWGAGVLRPYMSLLGRGVAVVAGKGEDVGGAFFVAVCFVHTSDGGIADQSDCDFGAVQAELLTHACQEGFEWWTKFMGRTAVSTQLGFMGTIACADIRADLPRITCPTLVITTEESGLGTVADTRAWQEQTSSSASFPTGTRPWLASMAPGFPGGSGSVSRSPEQC